MHDGWKEDGHTWQNIRVTVFADIALHVCLCVV
jgi:hypothetical protein